jgi:hypothetical protein
MRAVGLPLIALSAVLVTSCGTLEDYTWLVGVKPQDAREIRAEIVASTGVKKIYNYEATDDGMIAVSTDRGTYLAKRVGKHWKFTLPVWIT